MNFPSEHCGSEPCESEPWKVSLGKVSLGKVNFVGQLCRSTSDVKVGGEVLQVSPVKVKS